MPSRHANRNYLAGERQDATGFCRHGADLASQPALPYLRVRRLAQHTTFHETVFSGIFITIVMTGLDQDMMQKNLSCKSLKDAQKNMYTYGFAFTPVNFLFLSLGVLLLTLASQQQIELPALNDDILPMFCTSGILGHSILIFFTIGIITAAFSSADSALTALTTSFCIDILGVEKEKAQSAKRTRLVVHLMISILLLSSYLHLRQSITGA